jgi:hypothetical protein
MLGWRITIWKSEDVKLGYEAPSLFRWNTSFSGCNWLDELVAKGKAEFYDGGGYPNIYRAKARDVLPLIKDTLPVHGGLTVVGDDYVMSSNWDGNVEKDLQGIETCLPDEMLEIEAWDRS